MNTLSLCAAALLLSQAPMPRAENTGPNASIVRRAGGTYAYTTISDGRHRGEEHFQLLVHPDGSRTMMIWHDLSARNAQFSVVLGVASSFRPLEAYVSYWNGGQFKGSAMFSVDAGRLTAQSRGPAGPRSETIDVPQRFSTGVNDLWVTEQDRLVVKSSIPGRDLEYVLASATGSCH